MSTKQIEMSFDLTERHTPSGRRSPNGVATSDLIFSSSIGNNSDVFPKVLKLHVANGAKIVDVTYGKGVFWKNIDTSQYDFFPSDIADGTDCRNLPYKKVHLTR